MRNAQLSLFSGATEKANDVPQWRYLVSSHDPSPSRSRQWAHQTCAPVPNVSAPLGLRIMVRAPWDPQEPPRSEKRHRSDRQGGAHKPLRTVVGLPRSVLSKTLRLSLHSICSVGDPVLREYGTTFHSVVMVAWQEWGADVFAGTSVERAFWDLYRRGEIVMALRKTPGGSMSIPFFSLTCFHPNAVFHGGK